LVPAAPAYHNCMATVRQAPIIPDCSFLNTLPSSFLRLLLQVSAGEGVGCCTRPERCCRQHTQQLEPGAAGGFLLAGATGRLSPAQLHVRRSACVLFLASLLCMFAFSALHAVSASPTAAARVRALALAWLLKCAAHILTRVIQCTVLQRTWM
jgi:hypothetical protein